MFVSAVLFLYLVGDCMCLICEGVLYFGGVNDEFCSVCSKKDQEVRTSELLDAVSGPLLESVASEAESWISKSSIGMVTLAVLKSGKG
jgi:hypothetical protein